MNKIIGQEAIVWIIGDKSNWGTLILADSLKRAEEIKGNSDDKITKARLIIP